VVGIEPTHPRIRDFESRDFIIKLLFLLYIIMHYV